MFEICDVLSDHLLGEAATGVIARFCGSLAITAHQRCALLLAGCSLVVAPSQKAAKTHTYVPPGDGIPCGHTRPTEVSRIIHANAREQH